MTSREPKAKLVEQQYRFRVGDEIELAFLPTTLTSEGDYRLAVGDELLVEYRLSQEGGQLSFSRFAARSYRPLCGRIDGGYNVEHHRREEDDAEEMRWKFVSIHSSDYCDSNRPFSSPREPSPANH